MHWLETALLVALAMAQTPVPHANGSCRRCQIAMWQWSIMDAQGWDPLYLGYGR